MRFKCNLATEKADKSHKEHGSRICTLDKVDSYAISITSGVTSISMDITNGLLARKTYYCPICKEKLLWDKKYKKDNNTLSGGAAGTFTMVNDNDEQEATVPPQYDIDRVDDDNTDEEQVEIEILPEDGQPRYNYKKTKWTSATETESQKNSISWEDLSTGYIYYGTKAMNNIERGIHEAHRKFSFRELQTKNLALALRKLRMNEETSIAMWGDSVFWGFWTLTNEKYKGMYENDVFTDDYGKKCDLGKSGYYACIKRIPETMVKALNTVYDNKITLIRKIWTGTTVSNQKKTDGTPISHSTFKHWKASKANIAIMNFGINDAIGAHVPIDYQGKLDLFIEGYKALIERELENGTAVVIVSPFRQSTIGRDADIKADLDDRTIIDIYEQATYSLCQEYGIPFVDGNILLKNFDNELFVDFTHLTPDGNESIGKRLASILIGQNVLRPLSVHHNSYLSVFHQYSNCNLTGTANYSYSTTSPNIKSGIKTKDLYQTDVERTEGAIECVLKAEGDSIIWSVYCETDGMVVIPSFENKTTSHAIKMELDFGAIQGAWPNYWNFKGYSNTIDRNYREPSFVTYKSSDLDEHKIYGYHMIDGTHNKAIKIVGEGWHTIRLEMIDPTKPESTEPEEENTEQPNQGDSSEQEGQGQGQQEETPSAREVSSENTIKVYGLTFMDIKEFEKVTKSTVSES